MSRYCGIEQVRTGIRQFMYTCPQTCLIPPIPAYEQVLVVLDRYEQVRNRYEKGMSRYEKGMSRYWWYQAGLRTGMHKLSHTCSYLFNTTIPAHEQVLVVSDR